MRISKQQVADLLAGLDYRRGAVLPLDQLDLLAQAGDEIGRTFTREAPLRAAKAAAAARVSARAKQDADSSGKARRAAAAAAVSTAEISTPAETAADVPPPHPIITSPPPEPTPRHEKPQAPRVQEVLGADSVLPVFIFALARARVANLGSLVQTLTALIAPQHRPQAAGYYLATLQAAYDVLVSFEDDDEKLEVPAGSAIPTND